MLAETAAEAARRFGPAPAFVTDEGLTLSYAQFDTLADEAAVGLAELGVGEGDVVGLLLPSVPEHFVVYVAAAKLGAVDGGGEPQAGAGRAGRGAAGGQPAPSSSRRRSWRRAGTDGRVHDGLDRNRRPSPAAVLEGLRRVGERPAPLATDHDRPIAIVFTSGTTGMPKGAVFCGRQIGFITQCDVGEAWGGGGTPWRARRWPTSARRRSWPGT